MDQKQLEMELVRDYFDSVLYFEHKNNEKIAGQSIVNTLGYYLFLLKTIEEQNLKLEQFENEIKELKKNQSMRIIK
ncbi:hypothetical protein ACFVR2_08510 [Gottfriedia sp. NPDC057991]|uniref:hypothetical protein n=1 Tax=Gottfriedia sp. NPDC057991 TaxID=3346298 RepID=UPI0036DEF276